jgi:hypothetical protein
MKASKPSATGRKPQRKPVSRPKNLTPSPWDKDRRSRNAPAPEPVQDVEPEGKEIPATVSFRIPAGWIP